MSKRIKSALISVYNKEGIAEIVNELNQLGIEIYFHRWNIRLHKIAKY